MSPSVALHVLSLVHGTDSRAYRFACRLLAYGKADRVRSMASATVSLFVLAA